MRRRDTQVPGPKEPNAHLVMKSMSHLAIEYGGLNPILLSTIIMSMVTSVSQGILVPYLLLLHSRPGPISSKPIRIILNFTHLVVIVFQ